MGFEIACNYFTADVLNNHGQIDVIHDYFQKVFDRIAHRVLLTQQGSNLRPLLALTFIFFSVCITHD